MLSRWVIAFFPSSKLNSFNFMAVVTVCSDFGAHKNKVCHCFHCFPIYLPWSDKLILKFVLKCKGPRLWKTTLKKNKARGSKLHDFKNHYTSSVIKKYGTYCHQGRQGYQWNRIRSPFLDSDSWFLTAVMAIQWRKDILFNKRGWDKWIFTCTNINFDMCNAPYTKVNSKLSTKYKT